MTSQTKYYRWLFPFALLLSCIISNVGDGVGVIAVAVCCIIFVFQGVCRVVLCPFNNDNAASSTNDVEGFLAANTPPPQTTISSSQRLYYLDDLKTFLTVLVILHHCVGAFNGSGNLGLGVGAFHNTFQIFTTSILGFNQAYFMSLFFFISALMIPNSLARKGSKTFLRDRFKRLGTPFLLYLFIFGPLLSAIATWIGPGSGWFWSPDANVSWFLCWLLIFTTAAVWTLDPTTINTNQPLRARPSLLTMIGIGALCGFLQGIQLGFLPAFPFMPISLGSLPFDVVFFYAGLEATRNGWLRDPFPNYEVKIAKGITVFLAAIYLVFLTVTEQTGGGNLFLNTNACGQTASKGILSLELSIVVIACLTIFAGIYAVCVSISLLDIFRSFAASDAPKSNSWRLWFTANSYAAYLIHPYIVLPLTGVFIAIIRNVYSNNTLSDFNSWADYRNSNSCLGNHGGVDILIYGFLFVSVLSVTLTYPLAALVRMLPYAKDIL